MNDIWLMGERDGMEVVPEREDGDILRFNFKKLKSLSLQAGLIILLVKLTAPLQFMVT